MATPFSHEYLPKTYNKIRERVKKNKLQKIRRYILRRKNSLFIRHSFENFRLFGILVAERQNRRHVAAPVAVVGRRPHCDQLFVEPVLVAFLHQLMCATNQIETIYFAEFVDHLGSKQPTGASRRYGPRVYIFWIGPDQIAEGALVRYFLISFDDAYLIECFDFGRQTLKLELA